MIVNQHATGWEIIYHRTHALLAAQLAGHWKRSDAPIRLYETIAAISHHDDLEKEWDGKELTPIGTPLDFTLDTAVDESESLKKLQQMTETSLYRGRWVAFLISKHMSFLNEAKRGNSAEMDQFLDQQLENQEKWRQELKLTKKDVDDAYAFMQMFDRLSLILCKQQLPEDQCALEIAKGPDEQRYDVVKLADEKVTVKPWPFEDKQFTVNIDACYLTQVQFENDAEFTKALKTAKIEPVEWTFVKD